MTELPQTDELRRSEEGYDAVRVEEAFAAFAERVHELESVAGELREELRALRQERLEQERLERRPSSSDRYDDESWPLEDDSGRSEPLSQRIGPDWIASVPAPVSRAVAVPRFALEATFLLLSALFAGLADLSTTAIVIVMATALALVVLSEVATAATRARWRLDAVAGPAGVAEEGASESTGPWSKPVVEATVVEAPDDSESHTVVTKLPPELEAEPLPESKPEPDPVAEPDPESEPEPPPALEAEPPAEAEPELELVLEPEPTPELEPEPAPEPEPNSESETQPEAVAEPALVDAEADELQAVEPEPPEAATGAEPAAAEVETESAASAPSIPPAAVDPGSDLESDPESDSQSESEPRRRFGFLRQRRADEPDAETPDPWEI
ncbi:MAG: hypothetical protein ACR2GT_04750 [Gaiellaceae bacterium]